MTPEEIAVALRQGIREKMLEPGAALIQEDLAGRFGVSRNPVREALRMLVTEGLVDMRPGEGFYVRTLSRDDLVELYELRIALEPQLAASIIDEVRGRDLDELQRMAEAIEAATELREWIARNFEFHSRLFELSNRPRSIAILTSLLSAVQPYSAENVGRLGGRSQASREHFEMIEAIRGRDAEKLAGMFVQHLDAARQRLIAAYSETPAQPSANLLIGVGK